METQVQLTQNSSWWNWLCNFSRCTANNMKTEVIALRDLNLQESSSTTNSMEDTSEHKRCHIVGESGTEYVTTGVNVGKGSFSKVILAKRVRDGHVMAVKVSFPERTSSQQYLYNEYVILCELDHPNIIKALDFINYTPGISMIVFKYYGAGTLSQRLKTNGHLPEAEVKLYTYQLCSALAYIHKRGIVHSDVKPSNIVCKHTHLCQHGPDKSCSDSECCLRKYKIILIDFGIATFVPKNPNDFVPRMAGGTMIYMAPEVLNEERATFKADMWSLGVTVYELLTGAMPYDKPSINVINKTVKRSEAYLHTGAMTGVSSMAKDFIKKCLDMKVSTRISSRDALCHPWISPKLMNSERVSLGAIFKMTQLFCRQNYRSSRCLCVPKDNMQDLCALVEVYRTKDEANAMVAKYIRYPERPGEGKAPETGHQKIQFTPLHPQARCQCKLPSGIDIDIDKKVDIETVPQVSPARRVLPEIPPARRVLPQAPIARRNLLEVPPARCGLHHVSPAPREPQGIAIVTPLEQVQYGDYEAVPGPSFRAQRWRRVPTRSPRQLLSLPVTSDSESDD